MKITIQLNKQLWEDFLCVHLFKDCFIENKRLCQVYIFEFHILIFLSALVIEKKVQSIKR